MKANASRDGKLVAFGIQSNNRNLLLSGRDGTLLAGPISAHSNGTTCVAFSPDGTLLASGGSDGTVKLWHLPEMTLVRTPGRRRWGAGRRSIRCSSRMMERP